MRILGEIARQRGSSRVLLTVKPELKILEELKDYLSKNQVIKFEINGAVYEWKNFGTLELGYAGVMTPDGYMTFLPSARIETWMFDKEHLILKSGTKPYSDRMRIVEEGIIKHLQQENRQLGMKLFGSQLDNEFLTIAPRNGSHEVGRNVLNKQHNSEMYWGFAINPKTGTNDVYEIGFVSGQLHGTTSEIGQGIAIGGDGYLAGILDRSYQKKAWEFIKKKFEGKNLIMKENNGSSGMNRYW